MPKCTCCGTNKENTSFYSDSRNKCGIRQPCKDCLRKEKKAPENKSCGKCGIIKPINEFTKNIANSDGHNTVCSACASARHKEYICKIQKMKKPEITEKKCCSCKDILPVNSFYKNKRTLDGYTENCVACRNQKRLKEYADDPNIYKKRWERYMNDPETKKRYERYRSEWAIENPEKHKEACKNWHESNKEYHSQLVKNWYKTEKGKHHTKQKSANRRVLERSAGKLSSKIVQEIEIENIALYGSLTCIYCEKPIEEKYHLEHKIPLIRGGMNEKGNLAVSCQSCNLHKGTMTDKEYMERSS